MTVGTCTDSRQGHWKLGLVMESQVCEGPFILPKESTEGSNMANHVPLRMSFDCLSRVTAFDVM